jgi:putative membrane protein
MKGRKEKMWMHSLGGFSWIGMAINLVITLAMIVALVLLVVWIVRRTSSPSAQTSPQVPSTGASPKDIAQMRYARGEINREEYQQILADLDNK